MSDTHPIFVDTATYEQVTLLAHAWHVSPGLAVTQLLRDFQHHPHPPTHISPNTSGAVNEAVAVHAVYERIRITGRYNPRTQSLVVIDGPGEGTYKSPSGASMAVIRALRPDIAPNRSGWDFWHIDGNGDRLRTLRRP